jgi:hypothetical protein
LKKVTICCLTALLLICAIGYAVEPTTKPEETPIQRDLPPAQSEGGPLPFPEQMIVGNVTGSDGKPLGGVVVKLFANGQLVEVSHTTVSGSYEMRLPLNVEQDETVVMWFISTAGDLTPQVVVLKKSSAARNTSLFSPCTAEVRMRPQMRVDTRLVNESEFLSELKAKGCL